MTKFYKELAKKIHPDKNNHPLANQVFQKVSQAYQAVAPLVKNFDMLRGQQ